jgi:hypothetical protein
LLRSCSRSLLGGVRKVSFAPGSEVHVQHQVLAPLREILERDLASKLSVGRTAPAHRAAAGTESVNALTGVLADLRGAGRFVVSVQNPLVLGEHGEHYPDLVLYREGVRGRVPEARNALVVVEVADTSVSYDRNIKLPLYAHAGVPEAWLVDLRAGVVEVHSGPQTGGYGAVRMYARGEVVRSATLAEVVAFGADEVLPG